MAAAVLIGLFSSGATEADGTSSAQSRARSSGVDARVLAPEKCPSARRAVAYYRSAYYRHRARMGAGASHEMRGRRNHRPGACSHVRNAAWIWRQRARIAKGTADAVLFLREARRYQRLSNPTAAICHVFGSYCAQALRVASCESGRGVYAQNGQYLGMFQMGSYARARYGHGYTPLEQARAAYRYFVASGRDWSPWSCKP